MHITTSPYEQHHIIISCHTSSQKDHKLYMYYHHSTYNIIQTKQNKKIGHPMLNANVHRHLPSKIDKCLVLVKLHII